MSLLSQRMLRWPGTSVSPYERLEGRAWQLMKSKHGSKRGGLPQPDVSVDERLSCWEATPKQCNHSRIEL
jgi:hypothetical protein